MKHSNLVSSAVLSLNGFLFIALAARVWSAPDVFAADSGFVAATQPVIDQLVVAHAPTFLGLGAIALAGAFAPVVARWGLLFLVSLAAALAYAGAWTLGGMYEAVLWSVLGLNVAALVTAFFGEPLRRAAVPTQTLQPPRAGFRWG